MGRPLFAHRVHHLQNEPGAILKAAAVCVAAMVGQRRKKLVQQIAVRGMNFNHVEAGAGSAARALPKRLDHRIDARLV